MVDESNSEKAPPQNVTDPVCRMAITTESPYIVEHRGTTYFFCSQACEGSFRADPERYLRNQTTTRAPR